MAFRCLSLEIFKIAKHLQKNRLFGKEPQKCFVMASNSFFSEPITKHLELITKEKIPLNEDNGKVPLLTLDTNKPLAVLFEWISAEKKTVYKYANLYLERGYDVLAVSLSVRNLLWPVSGSQVIASETLEFLSKNAASSPLLVHGFSIGGYVWGEVLVKIEEDLPKYQPIIRRVKGQVWDSTPDVAGFYKGFPRAVFPNNALLRLAVEKSIVYHLRIFQNTATKHYHKASQLFHDTPVTAPALFFVAKNDLVASYDTILKLKEYWASLGRKTYLKSWEQSKHVSHLRLHQEDYIKTLDGFLVTLDEPGNQENESEMQKSKL